MAADMQGLPGTARHIVAAGGAFPSQPNNTAFNDIQGVPSATQDSLYDFSVLALHGGGENNSASVTDYSKYRRTVTAYNAVYDTSISQFDGSAINFTGGSSSHAEVGAGINFSSGSTVTAKGAQDFVVDLLTYIPDGYVGGNIVALGAPGSGTGSTQANRQGIVFGVIGGVLRVRAGNLSRDGASGYIDRRSADTFITGRWNHFRYTVRSNILTMHINGLPTPHSNGAGASSTVSDFSNLSVYRNAVLNLGGSNFSGGVLDSTQASSTSITQCRIQELRIYLGAVKELSQFVPPIRPYSDF